MTGQKKPLIWIVEDFDQELEKLEAFFQEQGYRTKGFLSRKELYKTVSQARFKGQELPVAIVIDFAAKNDMDMEKFLRTMNMKFPDIPIFISTVQPGLLRTQDVIMPLNTKGVFHRLTRAQGWAQETPCMDELLESITKILEKNTGKGPQVG